jgi:hypothetical protein
MQSSKPESVPQRKHKFFAEKIALYLTVTAVAAGCQITAPVGPFPLHWGEDAQEGAHRLGLTSIRWQPWSDPAFEIGVDLDHTQTVFGIEGMVNLVRTSGKSLEGIQVIYQACAHDEARKRVIRDALRSNLQLEPSDADGPYKVWSDRSLVRFAADPVNDRCVLTIAGPRFGPAFSGALIREGFQNLRGAMGPR